MINKTVPSVIILENGYYLLCNYDPKHPSIGTIQKIINMARLFKFDMKKQKKDIECKLYFINEDKDPFQPPIIETFTLENHTYEGFREMVKFQLKSINNTKVIYEIVD